MDSRALDDHLAPRDPWMLGVAPWGEVSCREITALKTAWRPERRTTAAHEIIDIEDRRETKSETEFEIFKKSP
jgi:hypothetical protein